jgi:hypothetical protein
MFKKIITSSEPLLIVIRGNHTLQDCGILLTWMPCDIG